MATESPIITKEILKAVSDVKFTRTKRREAPAHFTLEIESWEQLLDIVSKPPLDRYESTLFQAGDYKWRLILYPEGDKQSNGDGYVSLYLKIEEMEIDEEGKRKFEQIQNLKSKWEVNVLLKFFVFIYTENQFECIQDGRLKRFNAVKKEWGFSQLLPLNEFKDQEKGYLSGGECKFGVEVFVVKSEAKGECFSIQANPSNNLYSWTANLPEAKANNGHLFSDEFSLAGYKWKLHLYPEGLPKAKKEFLSIFLCLQQDNQKLPYGSKMYVEFKIRIIRPYESEKRKERSGTVWLTASDAKWGFPYFMKVADLKDLTNLDSIKVEAEISSISDTTPLSPDPK